MWWQLPSSGRFRAQLLSNRAAVLAKQFRIVEAIADCNAALFLDAQS